MATHIRSAGKDITLSPDQERALDEVFASLKSRREATLAGAAGTGKSTVTNAIIQRWGGKVILLAPTGKAAVRLREVTGRQTQTIHSAIYATCDEEESVGRRETLIFGEPRPPVGAGPRTLVVVDEASMVSRDLYQDVMAQLRKVGAPVVWVGDHEQLPPVEGLAGPDLAGTRAKLTQVHRQALESPVLELATLVREHRAAAFTRWGDRVSRRLASIEDAVTWAEERPGERILLTWTNRVRQAANALTRGRRGYTLGEVQVGESLLCTYNNYGVGLMNGETLQVHSVRLIKDLTAAVGQPVVQVNGRYLMAPSTFDAWDPQQSDRSVYRKVWEPLYAREQMHDVMRRAGWNRVRYYEARDRVSHYGLQGTWGYCLTVHKAQGSQWPAVSFLSCPGYRRAPDDDFKRRLTYTAITRAEQEFHAFLIGNLK